MIDKFGNAFYLIIFLAHFAGIVGMLRLSISLVGTKKFLKGSLELINLLALMVRFAGQFYVSYCFNGNLCRLYKTRRLNATWAFFNWFL